MSGSLPPGLSFSGKDIVVQSGTSLVPGKYAVQVVATDAGGLSGTGTVNITVTDENTPPVVVVPATVNVPESQRTVLSVVASDTENDPLVISLEGPDANEFTLANTEIQFVRAPDFENDKREYAISVVVSDGINPPLSTPVTVNVINENEAPFIVPGNSFTVSQGAPGGTVAGTVVVNDPDVNDTVTLSGNLPDGLSWQGSTIVVNPGGNLVPGEYAVQALATDAGGLTGSGSLAITRPSTFSIL